MRKILISSVMLCIISSALVYTGCSDGLFTGEADDNAMPEVWLSSGPVEGDTTGYQVHFYWSGWDPDGEISHFEFVVAEGSSELGIGFNPADTAGADKWRSTAVHDSVFRVEADENPRAYEPDDPNSIYTRYDKTHTLFLRAVDLQGRGSKVVHRSFTAWTIAPICFIEHPPVGTTTYSTVITFRWTARDPIDSPSNSQDPDSIRYLYSQVLDKDGIYSPNFRILDDFNANPQDYEHLWSNWIWYRASGDSGKTTKIGDDEVLELNRRHFFAVQAKDEAGAVTAIFENDVNIKQFLVSWKQGPLLTLTEPFLGGFQFLGTGMNPIQKRLPPGIPLNFCWKATADDYGGEIVGFRYGWDIQDLNDPAQWAGSFSPFTLCALERTLYSGIHTLFVEAKDDGGRISRARIEIEIIQFTMDRDLLWVDDFASTDAPNPARTLPLESEHDEFWLDICSRVPSFIPDRDQYDVQAANNKVPEITLIGRYANIIWTYSSTTITAWNQIIPFTPESMVGSGGVLSINYLSLFLAKGGHLLTLGRPGGLVEAFLANPQLPASFKHDMSTVSNTDTSGVNSMPYKDYCVTIVDKVTGNFHTAEDMPDGANRSVDRDAMMRAVRDEEDEVVQTSLVGLPDTLALWSEVTDCPVCFFNLRDRGFSYVELYDVEYYMEFRQIAASQGCFHPMYRMRSMSVISPLYDQPVALVITKYRDLFYGRDDISFIPAYSFHFGFPLWFFDREDVDQVMNVIFEDWQLEHTED
ncbi:MAG: hypothetical protein KAV42_00385 [Candidatus Krumholzibacteria bacterium]|nr:hypothetical protein [Candidatus Krumholzibacteria bacterium]